MNSSNGSQNVLLSESELRKQKYKDLLELGVEAVKNQENNSIVDNLKALTDLIEKTDNLFQQANSVIERAGESSSEALLDAQV